MEEVTNGLELMIAEAEARTKGVHKLLDDAREASDEDKAEIAECLVDFCETEEKAVRLYVRMITEYPEMADSLNTGWPHFQTMVADARQKWEEYEAEHQDKT